MSVIDRATDIIRHFSPDAADAFVAQPFARVDIAFAFAAGFTKDDSDDVHPAAAAVIDVAIRDRDIRAMRAQIDAAQGGAA